MVLKDNPAVKAGQDLVRKERIQTRLKPVFDQRSDGMSKEAVEQNQDRQAPISVLVSRVVGLSKKKELMKEFFPDEGAKFTRTTDRSKQIVKDQGNIEAFEILELSNKVQCQHCLGYATRTRLLQLWTFGFLSWTEG